MRIVLFAVLGLACAVGTFGAAVQHARSTAAGAHGAPGLSPMTVAQAEASADTLLQGLLLAVYAAFGLKGEAVVYDRLAIVADGAALEALYLERAGAMVGGGLTTSEQTIHEVRMTEVVAERAGDGVEMDATWDVIGSVGHDDHSHLRGNRYRAKLTVAPADGAWKITDFVLTDVDRTAAGEAVAAGHE